MTFHLICEDPYCPTAAGWSTVAPVPKSNKLSRVYPKGVKQAALSCLLNIHEVMKKFVEKMKKKKKKKKKKKEPTASLQHFLISPTLFISWCVPIYLTTTANSSLSFWGFERTSISPMEKIVASTTFMQEPDVVDIIYFPVTAVLVLLFKSSVP